MSLIQSLRRHGQSAWLDGFERSWISRGQLQHSIDDGVRCAFNFEGLKLAIQEQEYDRDFGTLAQQSINRTARSYYDYLIVRDLQLAADLLKQTHSQTHGRDGYIQVDIPPHALFQAETAIAAAQKIWRAVGWRNLMLRIPATQIMLPVIEQLIGDLINVNVTLVFSQMTYEQVLEAYLRGLEKLIQQGDAISDVACFTSFSMGRLDAAIDPLVVNSLAMISFGITQAKLLYQHYRNFCRSERFLCGKANPPRLVWDCTGISPQDAWRYIQSLVAPETVIVLSPSTLETYREVSLLPTSLIDELESAEKVLANLPQMNITLDEIVQQLVNEEIARSRNAFDQLLDAIRQKRIR